MKEDGGDKNHPASAATAFIGGDPGHKKSLGKVQRNRKSKLSNSYGAAENTKHSCVDVEDVPLKERSLTMPMSGSDDNIEEANASPDSAANDGRTPAAGSNCEGVSRSRGKGGEFRIQNAPSDITSVRPGAFAVRGMGRDSSTTTHFSYNDDYDEEDTSSAPIDAFVVSSLQDISPSNRNDEWNDEPQERNELDDERIREIIIRNAPIVEGVTMDGDKNKNGKLCSISTTLKGHVHRHPKRTFLVLTVLVLGIIVGTTIGFLNGFSSSKTKDENNEDEGLGGQSTDTMAPTSASSRFESIKALLLSNEISTNETLGDTSSFQRRALDWIVHNDTEQLPSLSFQDDPRRLIQRYVLATFFYATGGGDGLWNRTYNFLNTDVHECNWWSRAKPNSYNFGSEGVFCSRGVTDGTVDALFIFYNNITGSLPSELRFLSNLAIIGLFGNPSLSGSIPPSLSHLTDLVFLALNDNSLSGTLPEELSHLIKLERLFLYSNRLNGTIPPSLGNLTSLYRLDLADNDFEGPLPSELGQLMELDRLHMFSNRFTGTVPTYFGNLMSMVNLSMSSNLLSGPIPAELGQLTSLKLLAMDFNGLSGPIPPSLGNLTSLAVLVLSSNQLNGTIPVQMERITNLQVLYLNSNQLSGAFPRSYFETFEGVIDLCLNNFTNRPILCRSNGLSRPIPSVLNGSSTPYSYGSVCISPLFCL